MKQQPLAQVLERLTLAAQALPHPLLATDADGTLWSGDVGVDAFEAMLARKALRPESLKALQHEARAFDLPAESSDPHEIAALLYEAYHQKLYPEERCYEMMAWAFAGYTVEEAQAFARVVQTDLHLAERLHPEMRLVLAWAQEQKVPVRIVSASPELVVQMGAALLGLDASWVLGAKPVIRDAIIEPQIAEPIPYGPGKVRVIDKAYPGAEVVAAFGDNVFDIEMMNRAKVPVAIRPKPRLQRQAHQVPGLVELEPIMG